MCASATASASTSARSSPLMPTPRRLLFVLLLCLALVGVGGGTVRSTDDRTDYTDFQATTNDNPCNLCDHPLTAPAAPHARLAPLLLPRAQATATTKPREYRYYVQKLRETYFWLDHDGKGSAEETFRDVALMLLPPDGPVIPRYGGPPLMVNLGVVRAAIEQQPPRYDEAKTRLLALVDLLDPGSMGSPSTLPGGTPLPTAAPPTPGPPCCPRETGPPTDDATALHQLDQVLADPRFQYEQRTTLQQRLSAFMRPFVEALFTMDPVPRAGLVGSVAGLIVTFILYIAYSDRPWSRGRRLQRAAFFGAIVGSVVAGAMLFGGLVLGLLGPVAPYLLGAGGLLAAALAIGVAVLGLRRGRNRGVAHMPLAHAEANWTAAHAQTAAAEAAAGGDYRRAIRYRYLATMLELDEADRLRFDRALTNLEHLRRAPAHLREALRPLVLTFDRVWYGGSPASAADYQQYSALAQAVEATPAEPEAPA